MKVPLLDLKSQYATLKPEMLAAVSEVLASQLCIGGEQVAELEQRVAAYSGAAFGVGASSGTDAILNCLMSLELGPGDEVITSPFTFFATAGCIARTGAKCVFVDIEADTFNIDPALVETAVTKKTSAIIPVHLFGQTAEMDSILKIAGRLGLAVIEDAAQAIGSEYKGRKAGSMGLAGCFSFFPSKNLGGIGDGGMVVTSDEDFRERLMIMRNHGSKPKYYHRYIGGNFRLDAIQAAALLVKLPHLDDWSARRRANAAYYDRKFAGTPVGTPVIRPGCVSIFNQYVVRVPRRDELAAHLREAGIGCEIYYPVPLHMQECFASLGYRQGDFPVSERAAAEVLALPVYPELTDEMKDVVVDKILSFLS